jgi:SAM-dependent methyltransferase
MLLYDALNHDLIKKIPLTAKRILDVGCGTGVLGKFLKETRPCYVEGITYSEEEAKVAALHLDKVYCADLNSFNLALGKYDCIIFSHILEHTYHPEQVLRSFTAHLTGDGCILVALPNILFYKQRFKLLGGSFRYTEGGLMDNTHFRFFDWTTAQELFTPAGLSINYKQAHGNIPLPLIRKALPGMCAKLDNFFVNKWPGLFGFQFVFVARVQ